MEDQQDLNFVPFNWAVEWSKCTRVR